ncbi:MAG: ergothioneine biosynthesis protein EgtB [Betaproteobacteria bacterium]|nr:ergothioneine biosynthesis protein EgtB [Betaproteobacteria bacterium]
MDPNGRGSAPAACENLRSRYARIRAHSFNLARPLSEEDCCVQSMPEASPVKWHLAHTTWFFETFVLEKYEKSFTPFLPAFKVLFNSYYNGVGEKHPRAQRGLLTRPALHEVLLYRKEVNERMEKLFAHLGDDEAFCTLVDLGLHHEQQHQELILTDVKHLLSLNPLKPAYREQGEEDTPAPNGIEWLAFHGGLVAIGHGGDGFCFDNESPRHRQYLNPYSLASRLVTNGEFLDFMVDGGYRDPRLWLSDGWDWVQANRITHPIYWEREDDRWDEFTLGGKRALDSAAPAVHISYFEADAYARWADARLPSEAEWEHAARAHKASDDAHRHDRLHPRPAKNAAGLQQMFGDAWQWTQTSYAPYPGYLWPEGAVGEYNGKFMVNQYVLRGSSCLTPGGHSRATYRNFFPATARWQLSGIRLAKDSGLVSTKKSGSASQKVFRDTAPAQTRKAAA